MNFNYFIIAISRCKKLQNERFCNSLFNIRINLMCEWSHPHPPLPSPNIFKPARRQHIKAGPTGLPCLPQLRGQKWRAGSPYPGRVTRTTSSSPICHTGCTLDDHTIARYNKQVVGAFYRAQNRRRLFKLSSRLSKSLIFHLLILMQLNTKKNACKGESTN